MTKKYNAQIPLEDLDWNLERLCSLYFEDGKDCNCYKQLLSLLREMYDNLKDCSYEYIEGNMDGKIHNYKTDTYRRDLILKVRKTLEFDEATNNFVITNRKVLLEKLKEVKITEKTFKNHINRCGFGVVYKELSPKNTYKNKGKCLENYIIKNNTVEIPKNEVTSAIKKYCSINKITIIRL